MKTDHALIRATLALLLALTLQVFIAHADWYTGAVPIYEFENGAGQNIDYSNLLNATFASNVANTTGIVGASAINCPTAGSNPQCMINISDSGYLDNTASQVIGFWYKNKNPTDNTYIFSKRAGTIQHIGIIRSNGSLDFAFNIGGNVAESLTSGTIIDGLAHCILVGYNGTHQYAIIDNTTNAASVMAKTGTINTAATPFILFSSSAGNPSNGTIDEFFVTNTSLTTLEVQTFCSKVSFSVSMLSLNCTSCSPFGVGDTSSPYLSADTTPTFAFDTNTAAYCRIGVSDVNYTTMGSSRNCTSGEGATTGHICSLTGQDTLSSSTGNVYISCSRTTSGSESSGVSTSGALAINGIATTEGTAIDYGIYLSSVWPGATIYSDQQVYLRDLNNNEKLATVDRVVAYGNQRWLFNYNETNTIGLFNITPVVYVLEMVNLSYDEVKYRVATLINSTKS